ncbi:MAG: hypothetical protein AB7I33_03000 [Gemmatimonadales bacterium]
MPRLFRPRAVPAVLTILAVSLAGCQAAASLLNDLFTERPPAPLSRFTVASDARIDSTGWVRGSFVGEGTARAVHLISSDTGLIAELARRYRPDAIRRNDVWGSLARAGIVTIDPSRLGPATGRALLVGAPSGHTRVALAAVLLRGSQCGWRGAQAELIVEAPASRDTPSLLGPVVGSFRLASEGSNGVDRTDPAPPGPALTDSLIAWTSHAMDSTIESRLATDARPLTRPLHERLFVNTLFDIGSVDVVPFRVQGGRLRYAVALRARRITARKEPVLAATVMVWDSTGSWQQVVFVPTLLDLTRDRVQPRSGWRALYWRRLQAVSGFAYSRDYLWMEQTDPDGNVLWGAIDPSGNVIVAAAEAQGACVG